LGDVDDGAYGLDFLITYDVDGKKHNKTHSIQLVIKEKPDFTVSAPESISRPGLTESLNLEVENTGTECDSVTLWVLKKSDHPFDFEDKSQYIGDLKKGEIGQAVINFEVDSNAIPKEYRIPLEVRCVKDDKVHIIAETAKIRVAQPEKAGSLPIIMLAGLILFSGLIIGLWKKMRG
jgi:hypothetical protein